MIAIKVEEEKATNTEVTGACECQCSMYNAFYVCIHYFATSSAASMAATSSAASMAATSSAE